MSPTNPARSPVDPIPIRPSTTSDKPATKAVERLNSIRRALQRQARRKLKGHEQNALERAARMTLRAEIASLDANSDSNDVVRLDNAAARARRDYERLVGIAGPKREHAPSLQEVLARG